MNYLSLGLIFLLLQSNSIFAQIDVTTIRSEVSNLSSNTEIMHYWDYIETVDQDSLVTIKIRDYPVYSYDSISRIKDSIAYTNMIRSAIMIEVHGTAGLNANRSRIPLLAYTHHPSADAMELFFPYIEFSAQVGGSISTFGGEYPYYPINGLCEVKYNTSIILNDTIAKSLRLKMDTTISFSIADSLNSLFIQEQKRKSYKIKDTVGVWLSESFNGAGDFKNMSIVTLEDGRYYYKDLGCSICTPTPLIELELNLFGFANNPFEWYLRITKSGRLSLVDSNNLVIMEYDTIRMD